MKLRLPGRRADTTTPDTTVVTPHGSTAVGAGKGRPTPKRNEAQGRRTGPVPPPPTTRKEAYRRMREQQSATGRGSAREAAARGDDSSLTARDRGPERRLVRDVVDARRNLGSFFLVIAALLLVSLIVPSQALKVYSSIVLYAFFLVLIVDSLILSRKIKAKVAERFPNSTQKPNSLAWYGVSRATMIRRWRFPKPQVAVGAEI